MVSHSLEPYYGTSAQASDTDYRATNWPVTSRLAINKATLKYGIRMRCSCRLRIALLPDDDERSLSRGDRIWVAVLRAVQPDYHSSMGQKDRTIVKESGVL